MDGHSPPGLANQHFWTRSISYLVVVGDQSSGKSSVLESLTGFSFPQAAGLCTRYATQITCRREHEKSVTITIIPRSGADTAVVNRLRSFKRTIPALTNQLLTETISDVNRAMGIKMTADNNEPGLQALSQDILKIEINGPEQEHFTVIDVPGIFRVPSPPLTTDNDVDLVRNMVKSYMENSRTIILAVLPSNVDISTQEILKMAGTADSDGIRTMGVLTKPDLVTENATRDIIKDLVLGKRNQLRLGYCIVKNRSADDQGSNLATRLTQEKVFFSSPMWKPLSATRRCGIESLKPRLSDLLMSISKREFPNVKSDIAKQLDQCRGDLDNIGPARKEQAAQRMFLGKLGSRFRAITQCALNGYYDGERIFVDDASLKLITNVTKMNEAFANDVWAEGHKRQISQEWNNDGEGPYNPFNKDSDNQQKIFENILSEYPELHDIVQEEDYDCPEAKSFKDDPITEHIERVYQDNRGPELGTFSGAILAATFKEQSEKWEPLVLAYISKIIMLVHDYISKLITHICPDKQVRSQLWDILLVDEIRKTYIRAMDQARFLLHIERDGRPSTYNNYFNSEVQKKRNDRLNSKIAVQANTFFTEARANAPTKQAVPVSNIQNFITNKDNMQQVREDIPDVLASYYKVSRKRFVDVVCRQVIGHFLLDGEQSPLKVFSPELVMGLEDDVLEMIAGEDAETKDRRATLEAEIKSLEAAMKLLRG